MLSHLSVSLGHTVDGLIAPTRVSPEPATLSASLHALLARGARLQSLTVCFHDHQDIRREAQL